MAAPSMAATLAATLPAPASAPAPAAPTYEAIPASMSTAIDIEAEIPLSCVQLDALVVTKIVQHGREAPSASASASAHGLLLGLDLDGTLEVSNCFPLPSPTSEEEGKSTKSIARYQASMLRSLKEVQGDDNVVGFYQATALGAFFNQTLIDTQAIHQERLRHGGVVIVHDVSQTARGNASFRAFRLTSSFMDAYKRGNFSSSSLTTHRLTFSSVLEEIPLRVRTNALARAFLQRLGTAGCHASVEGEGTALGPSLAVLDVGQAGLSRGLEQVSEAIDGYKTEDGNVAYLTRQIARERLRAEQYVAKRKEENAQRVAQGLSPLPEEDVGRLFKIPAEPNRLESMLLLGQLDGHARTVEGLAGLALASMYAATAAD